MKLADLKQGMVCELRNGNPFTVSNTNTGRKFYNDRLNAFFKLSDDYNDDLTNQSQKDYDIVKVTFGDETIYERPESNLFFEPKKNEYYYYIANEKVHKYKNDMKYDDDILRTNIVYKTREEAEKRLRQEQATLSVERWIGENDVEVDIYDTDKTKYYIVYDIERKELRVDYYNHYITAPKQFILTSGKKAEELIKEREKELKIMFGVEL